MRARETVPQSRSTALDALRGFALLGVILSNAPYFAGPAGFLPDQWPAADAAVRWFLTALVSGKFFLIFSFLFGYGLSVLVARTTADPAARRPLARRLAALALLGVLHAVFLFYGDILLLYALLGTGIWLVRRLPDRRLLVIAALSALLGIVTQTLLLSEGGSLDAFPPGVAPVTPGEGYLGNFADACRQRFAELPVALAIIALFNGLLAWAMILLGFIAGRRGVFPFSPTRLQRWQRPAKLALLAGAAVSLVASGFALHALDHHHPVSTSGILALAVVNLASPILSLGLVVTFWSWAERHPRHALARWPERLGEASLSGYLLHSLLLGAVFLGWGGGYFGTWGHAAVLATGAITFVLIIALLHLWPRRWSTGPAELLMTYLVKRRPTQSQNR